MWEIPEVGIIDEGHGNTLALEDDSLGCSDWKRRKTASRALYTSTLQSYEQPWALLYHHHFHMRKQRTKKI